MKPPSRRQARYAIAAIVAMAACASCRASDVWLAAPTPMRTKTTYAVPMQKARCLLVLLPGIGDPEQAFGEHGFIDAVHKRGISADIITANATVPYYARRTILDRLREDILASVAGYEQIWFGGISMGGLGSLLIAKEQGPAKIRGVILLAPYLGNDKLLQEIESAGGVERWVPGPPHENEDYQRAMWRWLKDASKSGMPGIYLGAGDQDRLQLGHHLLGNALPKEHVFTTSGGHEWGPWAALWNDFLDRSDFKTRCSPYKP